MRKLILIFAMLFLALIPVVFASNGDIIFENTLSGTYNIGDKIPLNFSIQRSNSCSDFIVVDLICNDHLIEVYRGYEEIQAGIKKYSSLDIPAIINGNCSISVSFCKETTNSNERFDITSDLFIDYSLNNKYLFPEDKLIINATIKRKQGTLINGIAALVINNITNKSLDIVNGNIYYEFFIDKYTFPKDYDLLLKAIEKNSEGNSINYGSISDSIKILSRPTFIDLVSNDSIKPSSTIIIRPRLLNQARFLVNNESVLLKIFDTENNLVYQGSVMSNQDLEYYFESNSSRGGWNVNAYYGNVFSSKRIYVEDNKQISVEVVNDSGYTKLKISNLGNVLYEGIVPISATTISGSINLSINVSIPKDSIKIYPIQGLSGTYDLNVDNKTIKNVTFASTPTGYAITPTKFHLSIFSYIASFMFIIFLVLAYLTFKKNTKYKKEIKKQTFDTNTEKRAYIAFIKFDKPFNDAESIIKTYNLSLTKSKDNYSFVLFNSYISKKPELTLMNLSKEIKKSANEKGVSCSIVINSDKYEGDVSLRNLATITKEFMKFSNNDILVSAKVYNYLGVISKSPELFQVGEKQQKMYRF